MISISNRDVINAVTGVIYEMHPYNKPEGIDVIVDKINEYFKSNSKDTKRFKIIQFNDFNEFKKELSTLLKSIPEFNLYNVSRKKQDEGVKDANDPRNQGFVAFDRFSEDMERYTDFIDLDACIQNIVSQIDMVDQMSADCFLCKYAKSYGSMDPGDERCKTCLCNPMIFYRREDHPMSLKPHNEWTKEEIEMYNLEH